MKNFYVTAFIASTLFALGVTHFSSDSYRHPAGMAQLEPFELQIQNLGLDAVSRVEEFENVYVRAVFNNHDAFEFSRRDPLTVARGEKRNMDFKVEIKDSWIHDDSLEFRLEIVKSTSLAPVVVRCATISKGLSTYNRSYQCTIPGEAAPVLVYRLARRGSAPVGPLASNN